MSLTVGVYENPSTGWIEGAAIIAAVVIVAVVTATNDYQKEQQFRKLSEVAEGKKDVKVGREGGHGEVRGLREIIDEARHTRLYGYTRTHVY